MPEPIERHCRTCGALPGEECQSQSRHHGYTHAARGRDDIPAIRPRGWLRAMRLVVFRDTSTAAYCDPCRESEHCGACPCCALDAPFARLGEP